jgi:hypothetical protein
MMKLIFAFVSYFVVAGAAFACEGKKVIFEDPFKDDSYGWDVRQTVNIGNSVMKITIPPENNANVMLNSAFFVSDADICAEGQMLSQPASEFGVMFWAADYTNNYAFTIGGSGNAYLARYVAPKWNNIFTQDVPKIKREPGANNQVRVVIKGNLISTFVNGAKVRDIRGQTPGDQSKFGIYVQIDRPANAPVARTYTVNSFKVTSVD